MAEKKKHSVGGAYAYLVTAIIFAIFLPFWADDVQQGNAREYRGRHRGTAVLIQKTLGAVGPIGASVIGLGLIAAAGLYLGRCIRENRPESTRSTASYASGGGATSAAPTKTGGALKHWG